MVVFLLGIFLISLVSATNVAYVLRNPERADAGFLNAFSELGLNVDLINDGDVRVTDFSGYDLIFVGDERLRNAKYLPIDSVSNVIVNGYYGKLFGLLEKGRMSKLAANHPLKIKQNGDVVKAYTTAEYRGRRINLPYYFIPEKYKKENSQSIATTFVGYKKELGDVISYLDGDVRKCFFGITKTKYWTEDSRELFKDCVGFAISGENSGDDDDEIEDGIHDVEIVEDYVNSVNGIRIKNDETGEYLLDEISSLMCGEKYKVDFKTLNVGDYTEDVLISGSVNGFEWGRTKEGLESGKSTTTGSKTITINEDFPIGTYTIEIQALIEEDVTPENNIRSRDVNVVCLAKMDQ